VAHTIGIDLGTTNSALAYISESGAIELASIPQLIDAGEVRAEPLLPSFLYLPGPNEFGEDALRLPWAQENVIVGKFAQRRGLENSGRLVASAKSLAAPVEMSSHVSSSATRPPSWTASVSSRYLRP